MADRIIIAIPTFRRPKSLLRLLRALADLETNAEITVIVADNDAENREGFRLCNRMATQYRWPLKAVMAPQRGIAQVRNILVTRSPGRAAGEFHRHD